MITLAEQLERLAAAALKVETHFRHKHGRWNGNAPGHGHQIPGVWDDDNGDLAGQPCQWCADWAGFRAALKAVEAEQ